MRRLLVGLHPAAWRARYGTEFRALLDDTPLTMGMVADTLRGAAVAHARGLAERARRPLAIGEGTVLVLITVLWLFLYWAAWHDIYAESAIGGSYSFELRWLVVIHAVYAAVGLYLLARRHRVAGVLTLLVVAVSLVWQHGIGPVPDWQETPRLGLVSLVWFALLPVILARWTLRAQPRRPVSPPSTPADGPRPTS